MMAKKQKPENNEEQPFDAQKELDEILADFAPIATPEPEEKPDHSGHRKRKRGEFWAKGGENMSELELLEILLYYANIRQNTTDLAKDLYDRFGAIENISYADISELSQVCKVGESVYTLFALLRIIMQRIHKPEIEHENFSDSSFLKEYLPKQFRGFSKERLMLYGLDTTGGLVCKRMLMSEDYGVVRFDPDDILSFLKGNGAVAVIMAHNHPNGKAIASIADYDSTRKLFTFLNENNVVLVEHYIVADGELMPIIGSYGEESFRKGAYRDYQNKKLSLM